MSSDWEELTPEEQDKAEDLLKELDELFNKTKDETECEDSILED